MRGVDSFWSRNREDYRSTTIRWKREEKGVDGRRGIKKRGKEGRERNQQKSEIVEREDEEE